MLNGGAAIRRRRAVRGMTLIEIVIAMALLAILARLAAPSFTTWTRNTQVRTVADTLQNALRMAQAESVRRGRQMVFSLTNDTPSAASTAVDDGRNWALHVVPLPTEALVFVQGGQLEDVAEGVAIAGPGAICFNSLGRRVANAAPGVASASCTVVGPDTTVAYDITRSGADRPLRVTVGLGGQVRLCDPNRSLALGQPEGC